MTTRIVIVLAMLVVWSGVVVARLIELQVLRHEEYGDRARKQQLIEVELHAPRGTIYDARGRELAVSVTVESAYVVSAELQDPPRRLLQRLEGVEGVQRERLARRLSEGREWSWVARKLDPPQAEELRRRKIPGVRFLKESHRYYPLVASTGPVLGFVGIDNNGLEGLEARYDDELSGGRVRRTMLRDARRGRLQVPGFSFRDAEPGDDLHLTIDATIQNLVERELRRAVAEHSATSGSAVVLDPRGGAVLAMASVPDFDPNAFADVPPKSRRNQVVLDAFEPGSTFKVITAAAALETNLVDPVDRFDCEMGAVVVDGRRIGDHKPFGDLSFREVIAKSSNVGAVKVGLKVGGQTLAHYIDAFGFGRKTGIDLPGENVGIVHPSMRRRLDTAYVAFGQGISVTPLQLATAFAAVANGGTLYRPYLVSAVAGADGHLRQIRPEAIGRPIAASTARSLERLLEAVVEEGTGGAAAVPGYRVAGKTGTAQVAAPGGGYYRDRHVASFVGFVPARDPALLALVAIHGPRPRYHGGEVAAPVFAAIARQALVHLGVPPRRTADPLPPPGSRTAAATPRPTPPGSLPDLSGLTARQAVARIAALGFSPRLNGRGVVVRQSPESGTPLGSEVERIELWLANGTGR